VDQISQFFAVKFRKDVREKLELKLPPPSPQICWCSRCLVKSKWSTTQLYSTVNSVQRGKTFNYVKCSRKMLFMCFSTQINFCHVFKMSAFGTNACFESWMLLVNGCVNCALFNAVPNVFLHSWKEWVMQQTKYCTNVITTSVSGRKHK